MSVERRGNGRSNFYQSSLNPRPVGNNQTSLETRPVQKLDQSRIQTTASLETRPEPVQKLDPNQRDQLNQTKREEVAYSAGAFVNYWNGKGNLPQVKSFTANRRQKLKARMSEKLFAEHWQQIIDKISVSSFCTGGNERGWRVDVDWLLKNAENYTKVFEGKYDNRNGGDQPTDKADTEAALKVLGWNEQQIQKTMKEGYSA